MHEHRPVGDTEDMAAFVPLAHAGHWLWVLYLPPILIVAGSILKTKLTERRSGQDENAPVVGDRAEGD